MTRFARASGSKGANEKQVEEASSWQELKAGLLNPPSEESGKEPKTNKSEVEIPSVEEIKSVWVDLLSEAKISSKKDKSKNKKTKIVSEVTELGGNEVKEKKKRKIQAVLEAEAPDKYRQGEQNKTSNKKNKKKKKIEAFEADEVPKFKKDDRKEMNKSVEETANIPTPAENPKKRRKEALKSTKVIINGQEVRVAPFDGFMVQADDALRLHKLRQDMRKKGIPKKEIEGALKMERRRAEKALAKLKKRVCFHCRGSGHNLSECPEVQEGRQTTGICFKCGSTEHTHFQCKVNRKSDFPFAECFVCKEQGHIARQCPDNPRGLYPRGGGCALCLDVTHLKKDCPKYLAQKSEELITVGHRNDRSLEALEEDQVRKETPSDGGKKLNKRIKF